MPGRAPPYSLVPQQAGRLAACTTAKTSCKAWTMYKGTCELYKGVTGITSYTKTKRMAIPGTDPIPFSSKNTTQSPGKIAQQPSVAPPARRRLPALHGRYTKVGVNCGRQGCRTMRAMITKAMSGARRSGSEKRWVESSVALSSRRMQRSSSPAEPRAHGVQSTLHGVLIRSPSVKWEVPM